MNKQKLFATAVSISIVFTIFLTASTDYAQNILPWSGEKIIGEKAPDFTLKDLSGKDVSLSSFKGRPVLLNFWATWCPYCRQERAHLKALYEEYKSKDLVIIAVATDRSTKTVKSFLERNPAQYISLTDPEGAAAAPYNVMSLPTSFIIDRNGKINRKFMGMVKWTDNDAKGFLDKLIKER